MNAGEPQNAGDSEHVPENTHKLSTLNPGRFLAEMQAQLDKISAKLDLIAADVKEMSENVRPKPKPLTLNP